MSESRISGFARLNIRCEIVENINKIIVRFVKTKRKIEFIL